MLLCAVNFVLFRACALFCERQGFEDITLRGTDLSTPQYFDGAYINKLALVDCVITVNHTEVRCKTPPGSGANLKATIVIEGQTSDPTVEAVSYFPPVITSVRHLDGSRCVLWIAVVVSCVWLGEPREH